MLKILEARLRQGQRTLGYPAEPATLPDRFRGKPALDPSRCPEGCAGCAEICPTDAVRVGPAGPTLDMGRCLFCAECAEACPEGAVTFTSDHRLATRRRDDLLLDDRRFELAGALEARMRRLFGRSLRLRQVSAGGCNACEADVNVLSTIVYDLSRFGIQIVASPRHADGLLVTGAITRNMEGALRATYEALPEPKIVLAVGACAISGGPYSGNPEVLGGLEGILPVDLYVPGCPPHPLTLLDGLLRLLGRLEETAG